MRVTTHDDTLCHVECDTTWWQTMPCWEWQYMRQTMPCWVWHYMMTDYAMLSVTVHDDRLCHVECDSTWWQTVPCWVWHDMMTDNAMLSLTRHDDRLCHVECAMLSWQRVCHVESVLTLILVFVPPQCYCSSTLKKTSHSAKSAGGRLQLHKHAPYVCGFAWSDMVHGCKVYTECAETTAVSCGSSHASAVSTPLWWILKMHYEKAVHSYRIPCERSDSAGELRIALHKNDQQSTKLATGSGRRGIMPSLAIFLQFFPPVTAELFLSEVQYWVCFFEYNAARDLFKLTVCLFNHNVFGSFSGWTSAL